MITQHTDREREETGCCGRSSATSSNCATTAASSPSSGSTPVIFGNSVMVFARGADFSAYLKTVGSDLGAGSWQSLAGLNHLTSNIAPAVVNAPNRPRKNATATRLCSSSAAVVYRG